MLAMWKRQIVWLKYKVFAVFYSRLLAMGFIFGLLMYLNFCLVSKA